ncbi:hypothetical protein GCM10023321_66500 [Pseudonocardia eucalypti]|uniref:Uncharacterized protein n=1 Tax=Pseudonocardia eucalypti TaxID=648755 RepID=A0ABP9R0G9_9PSEU
MYKNVIPEVDPRLPAGQLLDPYTGHAEHCLKGSPIAGTEFREAQLPGIAQVHHPAGNTDQFTGGGIRLEPLMRIPDFAQGVRARQHHGIRVDAIVEHGRALGPAHPDLLGKIRIGRSVGRYVIRHAAQRY